MTRYEERELILQAQGGDRAAMASLIRAHQEPLYAFMLRKTGRPDVAEDVVQEAFVRVLRNLDRFDPRFRFSTWLYTIARRLHLNAVQKCAPISESDFVQSCAAREHGLEPETRATHHESRSEVRDIVDRALRRLNPIQREVILLFHQLDWTITDIAEYLEIPEGTIKSHLHRARLRMRAEIEAYVEAARSATGRRGRRCTNESLRVDDFMQALLAGEGGSP